MKLAETVIPLCWVKFYTPGSLTVSTEIYVCVCVCVCVYDTWTLRQVGLYSHINNLI